MDPMFSFCENSRRDLEDQFFLKQDQKLLEELRAMQQMQETRESLARISGIKDTEVLDKLVSLNIRPETLAALTLVPLVEMAWADGSVDAKEKQAVLTAAAQHGFAQDSQDYRLLSLWLEHRPSDALLTAWVHYIKGLCQLLRPHERATLKHDLLDHAEAVARASGGILGFASVSASERKIMDLLESAFAQQ